MERLEGPPLGDSRSKFLSLTATSATKKFTQLPNYSTFGFPQCTTPQDQQISPPTDRTFTLHLLRYLDYLESRTHNPSCETPTCSVQHPLEPTRQTERSTPRETGAHQRRLGVERYGVTSFEELGDKVRPRMVFNLDREMKLGPLDRGPVVKNFQALLEALDCATGASSFLFLCSYSNFRFPITICA